MVAARAANPAQAAQSVAGKPPIVPPAIQTIPQPVGPQAEVALALKAWAAAWVTRDIGAYLAAYSREFVPANRQSKSEWEISRARALKRPGIRLQVSAENYTVEEPSRVSVRFVQRYASPGYRSGSACLNSIPRFLSGLRAGCQRCRVVHGGGRRLRRTDRRGGQLGAHQGFHLTRGSSVAASRRSTLRPV